MGIVVFLLGRPGSGKSSAARELKNLVLANDYTSVRICDYDILFEWFKKEETNLNDREKRFSHTDRGGFTVIDFSVLDEALEEVSIQAQIALHIEKYDFIFIEVARDNYSGLLRGFNQDALQNALFIFLDADISTCKQRIDLRTTCVHPIGNDSLDDHPLDNHFVSDDIIGGYYSSDTQELMNQLKEAYKLGSWQIKFIQNGGSWNDFCEQIIRSFQHFLEDMDNRTQQKQTLPNVLNQIGDSIENRPLAEVI